MERVAFVPELLHVDPYEPSLFLTILLSAIVFRRHRTALDEAVSTLVGRGTLGPNEDFTDSSASLASFRSGYRNAFNNSWRLSIIVLALIVAVSAAEMNGMGVIPDWPISEYSWSNLRSYVRGAWTLLLLWFLWQPLIAGIFISQLDKRFHVRIFPLHPDQCGALKALGDCCLKLALPFVIIGVMLLVWAFAPFSRRYQGMPEFSLLTLLLVLFPISHFAFLRPLWNIHGLMCSVRDRYQQEFAELLQARLMRLNDPSVPLDSLLANYDKFRQQFEELPTWPFRWRFALSLFSPQVLAIAKLLYDALPQNSATHH